jgi:hypothetical protein
MAPLSAAHRFRRVANLLNGSTVAGLAIARLGRATVRSGPDGLVLAEGYRLRFPVAGAFTVGNVILTATTFDELERCSPNVLQHEARHAWQYVCTGVLFIPLYVAAMGWSVVRTGDRAARNVFERWARLADGGYTDVPVRPLRSWFAPLLRRPRSGE